MNARILRLSIFHLAIKPQKKQPSMIKKIKVYLYLLLVDHFLQLNGINCAESSDVNSISEGIEDSVIEKQTKLSDGMKTSESNESTAASKDEKDIESPDKKNACSLKNSLVPSTTETGHLPSKINLLEGKIISIKMKLSILQHMRIPNILKICNEVKDLHKKIKEKIKEIKEKSKNHDPELIEKIEKTNEGNVKVYNQNDDIINNMRIKTDKLILAFEIFDNEYRKMDVHYSSNNLDIIYGEKYDYALTVFSNCNKTMEILKIIQDKFQSDKTQADSIFSVLSKFLEMTPEAFKADKEIANMISSLE